MSDLDVPGIHTKYIPRYRHLLNAGEILENVGHLSNIMSL